MQEKPCKTCGEMIPKNIFSTIQNKECMRCKVRKVHEKKATKLLSGKLKPIKSRKIVISPEGRHRIENNKFFKKCSHVGRPDGHKCKGRVEQEHPWERQNGMEDIFVPVCTPMNTNPSKKDRAWSKLVAIGIYGLDFLKEKNPKKDWKGEERLCNSFFI